MQVDNYNYHLDIESSLVTMYSPFKDLGDNDNLHYS